MGPAKRARVYRTEIGSAKLEIGLNLGAVFGRSSSENLVIPLFQRPVLTNAEADVADGFAAEALF